MDYSQNTFELKDSRIIDTFDRTEQPNAGQIADRRVQLFNMAMKSESHCGGGHELPGFEDAPK